MEEIAAGKATPAQISALLTALAMKGESVSEIAGFARVMRRKATAVKKPEGRIVVDTCGTGGDAKGTFNISTCAAIVAAGAGATVGQTRQPVGDLALRQRGSSRSLGRQSPGSSRSP